MTAYRLIGAIAALVFAVAGTVPQTGAGVP